MANAGPMRPADSLFPERREHIRRDNCVTCGGRAAVFKNALSAREFEISGLCQTCQDRTFNE